MREGITRALWLLGVVCVFCIPLFVGLGRSDMENDEAIYSYAVDGILATGDWLNPPLSPSNTTFLEKPPLKFWIVAAPIAAGLLPHSELGMRFWDALFGGAAFLYVFAFGRRLAGPVCGGVAVMVLFTYGPLLFDHGLRNNNMEAPLVLAYCGGLYHYLRWVRSTRRGAARAHVLAVCAFFYLGFMTKFVAALFLPVLLAVVTVLDREARARLRQDIGLWLLGGAAWIALAAPWFVYQHLREGAGFWRVILGEHVYQRFTTSLDPAHVKPWSYYFTVMYDELDRQGTAWLAVVGGALLVWHTLRERRLEMLLMLAWFAVPLTLISSGSSKLHHYLYPFLPPVALAIGYGPAWVVRAGRHYVDAAMARVQGRVDRMQSWGRGIGRALVAMAVVAAAISAATLLFGPLTWKIGGTQVFRNSEVGRPLVVALVLATFAGRGEAAARVLWPVALLLAIVPVPIYEEVLGRVTRDDHPLRTVSACVQTAHARQSAAGPPAPGVYAIGEAHWFLHSYFYYLRKAGGWEPTDTVDEPKLREALFVSGRQRPVMIRESDYRGLKLRDPGSFQTLPMLPLRDVLLLLPGPYAGCAPALSPLPTG